VALYVATILYWAALYLYVPILAPYVEHQGGTPQLVGLVISAYGLAQLLLRFPLGVVSDRIGRRKPFLALGFLAALLASLGFVLAPSPWAMCGARFMAGLSACAWVAFTVLFANYFPPNATAKAMGYISFCNHLAIIGATSLGGALAEAHGWLAPFWAAAGVASLGLLCLCFVYEPAPRPTPVPAPRHLAAILCSRELLLVSLIAALGQWTMYATTFGFVPIYAVGIGASKTQLGLLTTLSTLAGALASLLSGAYVIAWFGSRSIILIGHLSMAVATASMPVIETLVPLYGSQMLAGFGRGLAQPLLLNLAIRRFPDGEKATAMGFFQAVYAIGMFAGPATAGVVGGWAGYTGMFLSTAVIALCAAGTTLGLSGAATTIDQDTREHTPLHALAEMRR
jgi:MFS family permease